MFYGLTSALRVCRPQPRQLITPMLPEFTTWRVPMVMQIIPKNLINCSLYHCRALLKISSQSAYMIC